MRRIAFNLLLASLASTVHAAPGAPQEFQGDWVPRTATCQSPLRFRVGPDKVALINGTQQRVFGNVDFCHSCYGGAKYTGPVVMMLAEVGGKVESPFGAEFNAGGKMGVAKLDLQRPDLRRQFPLHQVALKRCIKRK